MSEVCFKNGFNTNGINRHGPHKTNGEEPSRSKSHDGASYEVVSESANYVRSRTRYSPTVGIVLGTGLGPVAQLLEDPDTIEFEDIPNFPASTVVGHVGRLLIGRLEGQQVICMQGRAHFYEGQPPWKITLPTRMMKLLGIQTLILTNASGSLNSEYNEGDIMVLKDHTSIQALAGFSPLVGPNDERFGPRFFPLSDAYDRQLRDIAKQAAQDLGLTFVREGVYIQQGGPAFESVSECRMLRQLGADVVGMSTTPEVIVARHCGLRILALSLVTNKCVMDFDSDTVVNHSEVLEVGRVRADALQRLVSRVLSKLNED